MSKELVVTEDKINTPLKIVMEDGTPLESVPRNPLIDKWKKEGHTKDSLGNECSDILGYYKDGRPIVNYNCVLCSSSECYLSDAWKVPEEDKETYEKWQKEVKEFHKLHNPEMFNKYLIDLSNENS